MPLLHRKVPVKNRTVCTFCRVSPDKLTVLARLQIDRPKLPLQADG